MRLHMVNAYQGDLEAQSQTFGEFETDGEIGAHPWTAGYGDEMGFAFLELVVCKSW